MHIFGYELCAVPASLVDEYGYLRKGNKAVLIHKLGVKQSYPHRPGVVIVDAQQLLYHVIWPCGVTVAVLAEARLSFCAAEENIVVFYRYEEISAKDHEGQWRADIGSTTFNLTINSPLPSREAVVRNKHNKRSLSLLLGTFHLGSGVAYLSKAGITASSVMVKQTSPSAVYVAGSQ